MTITPELMAAVVGGVALGTWVAGRFEPEASQRATVLLLVSLVILGTELVRTT